MVSIRNQAGQIGNQCSWEILMDNLRETSFPYLVIDNWAVLSSRCHSLGFFDQPQG